MTDEEKEILSELSAGGKRKKSVIGTDDHQQAKAGRSGIAACCPYCKYWFEVDDRDVKKSMMRKMSRSLDRKGVLACRKFLKESWGVPLNRFTRNPTMRSKYLGTIFQTGISKGLKHVFLAARDGDHRSHMAIAWNGVGETFDDNYICIPAGSFFEVFHALCNDSEQFANRAQLALNVSVKGHLTTEELFIRPGDWNYEERDDENKIRL